MADLDMVELRILKSLNAKIKSLGSGTVTLHWVNGRLKAYELTSSSSAENIYTTPTLDNPNPINSLLD